MNAQNLVQALYASELFTSPASTVDSFTEQLVSVVTRELDRVAPLQTRSRRRPKASSKWLSPDAIRSKRHRRKLERRWRRTELDADRTAYRKACRVANKVINESRLSYHSRLIASCADSKQRWSAIKNILHSTDADCPRSDDEDQRLCHSFAAFFVNRILILKQTVDARLLLL